MSFSENVGRFLRDLARPLPEFRYDPHLPAADDGTNWRKEGKVTIVGPGQVQSAVEAARTFGSPEAATAIGLSVAYIEKHFPEALPANET